MSIGKTPGESVEDRNNNRVSLKGDSRNNYNHHVCRWNREENPKKSRREAAMDVENSERHGLHIGGMKFPIT